MIVGMTVLRNATRMGYPWVESILSVLPVCSHFHIGEGYSTDNTWDIIEKMMAAPGIGSKLSVSRFEWPVMETGFAIGAATNDALGHIRHLGGKVLYVQADELWHPLNLMELLRLDAEDYDGYFFPFLHLEHNCQVIQQGAGYQWAIRMVANDPAITSHRDAWTFEGCQKTLAVHSLPHPIVHCNYCFWENVVLKKEVQALELYSDLGHYGYAAEQARAEHDAHPEPPEIFTRTESPFAEHLPPMFLPLIGSREYYVREELFDKPGGGPC